VSNKGSSGSGSNGSSGSGNEGKGDNSGGNSNSDENKNVPDAKMAAVAQPDQESGNATADDEGSARENRLMDKKRKRMDARREYEEQVKLDMNSSSSDEPETSSFVPGKPVTLDTALSFSRMARYVRFCCSYL